MDLTNDSQDSSNQAIESIIPTQHLGPDELLQSSRQKSGNGMLQLDTEVSEVAGNGGSPTQAQIFPSKTSAIHSLQPPATPCHKRPLANADTAFGPASRTRSAAKRQKWTRRTGFNMTEGFRTPH